MQGMAEGSGDTAMLVGNQEMFGCTVTDAHQNGSTGPEGTDLSLSAQSLTRQNFISSTQQRSSAASTCQGGFSPSEQYTQAQLMQQGAIPQGHDAVCAVLNGGG